MKRLAIAMVLAAAAAAQAATVRINETARARSAKVTLGEIAAVEGAGAVDTARLAAVVVAHIDRGAETAEVRSETVRSALAGAGFNLAEILITGAVCARVSRTDAGAAGSRTVVAAVESYLAGAAPEARFAISNLELDFRPPEGFVPLVKAVRPGPSSGPARFDVVDARDPFEVKGHAFARLAKSVKVVATRRRLRGGHRISTGDVQTTYVAESLAEGRCRSTSQVLGRRTLFKLAAGKPIPTVAIECEDAVKRGDEVRLEVASKSMKVSVKTVALESGAPGDVVRLRRVRGRDEYLGKVLGPGRAVPFNGGVQ